MIQNGTGTSQNKCTIVVSAVIVGGIETGKEHLT